MAVCAGKGEEGLPTTKSVAATGEKKARTNANRVHER
jgi:hypothetical protein